MKRRTKIFTSLTVIFRRTPIFRLRPDSLICLIRLDCLNAPLFRELYVIKVCCTGFDFSDVRAAYVSGVGSGSSALRIRTVSSITSTLNFLVHGLDSLSV